jgi:hypothetical protein
MTLAAEAGVRWFDTAPSYGEAEWRLGRFLKSAKAELKVSTKLGYGVPGFADWSRDILAPGIERARQRLQREFLDLVLLHSCGPEVLATPGFLDPLLEAKARGRVGLIGYSGDNEALSLALELGVFDAVMASFNPLDQSVIQQLAPLADSRPVVFAKRPLANVPWCYASRPSDQAIGTYWDRWKCMLPQKVDAGEWLRFVAFHPLVDFAVLGSRSLTHWQQALTAIAAGPLSEDQRNHWLSWQNPEWPGVV